MQRAGVSANPVHTSEPERHGAPVGPLGGDVEQTLASKLGPAIVAGRLGIFLAIAFGSSPAPTIDADRGSKDKAPDSVILRGRDYVRRGENVHLGGAPQKCRIFGPGDDSGRMHHGFETSLACSKRPATLGGVHQVGLPRPRPRPAPTPALAPRSNAGGSCDRVAGLDQSSCDMGTNKAARARDENMHLGEPGAAVRIPRRGKSRQCRPARARHALVHTRTGAARPRCTSGCRRRTHERAALRR